MGATTFVKTNTPKPTVVEKRRPLKFKFDVPLVVIVLCMMIFGLVMLYSASWDSSVTNDKPAYSVLLKQARNMLVGIVAAVLISTVDYHKYKKHVVTVMTLTVGLLLLVLLFGRDSSGPARGLFNGSIQPSEIAKLVTIVYLSVWCCSKKDQLRTFSFGLLPVIAILGLVGGLIMLQPDLSAAVTVFILGGIIFFLAGADWQQIIITLAFSVLIGILGLKVYSTGSSRLHDYLAGLQNITDSSYHVMRAMEAVINGGWFGVGLGQANTKYTGLPFPYTDSIFAIVVEELGFFGGVAVVALFGLLLWRGLTIAKQAPDQLGSLLASGVTIWIVMEAFLNMAVIIGLIPFAGNALPFFSSGGSNLVTSLMGIGILMNVSMNKTTDEKEGSFSAIVDLRRWNGRRRVSSSRRTSGTIEQS